MFKPGFLNTYDFWFILKIFYKSFKLLPISYYAPCVPLQDNQVGLSPEPPCCPSASSFLLILSHNTSFKPKHFSAPFTIKRCVLVNQLQIRGVQHSPYFSPFSFLLLCSMHGPHCPIFNMHGPHCPGYTFSDPILLPPDNLYCIFYSIISLNNIQSTTHAHTTMTPLFRALSKIEQNCGGL